MAKLLKIEQYGEMLKSIFDDGTFLLAYPTVGGLWYVEDAYTPPVQPPVDPLPGGGGVAGRFAWPFPLSEVTSEYGPRDGRLHAGMDFSGPVTNAPGSKNRAAADGTVAVAGSHSGYGNAVVIDHGGGLNTLYGHMVWGSLEVSVGQSVKQGQNLGLVGQTGNSFGVHLHFETHTGGYNWNATSMNPRVFFERYNA